MRFTRAKVIAFCTWLKSQEIVVYNFYKCLFGAAAMFMAYMLLSAFSESLTIGDMRIEARLSRLEARQEIVFERLGKIGEQGQINSEKYEVQSNRLSGLEHDVAVGKDVGIGTLCGVFILMLETLSRLIFKGPKVG